MKKDKKLVIYGLGETADIAYEYFTHDSTYEVVAFTVPKEYMTVVQHFNIPVIEFEALKNNNNYSPSEVEIFVAVSYTQLNRVRARCYNLIKTSGYKCANYISSKAFVWHNVEIGENCMIFENNVLQHKVKIGNGVILWSGNHIGHQSIIEDFVYVSSHVVISGFCKIGRFSFIGVNATFNDRVSISQDTIVSSGALVKKDFGIGKLLMGNPAKPAPFSSYQTFDVKQNEIEL